MPTRSPSTRRGFLSFRSITIISCVGAAIIVGAIFMRSGGGSSLGRPDVHRVARETFEVTATASGELRAKNQTPIRSELEQEGAIVAIVEEGSLVKKGDILVKLNGDEIRTQLDDEMLQRETARAEAISADNDLKIQITENAASVRKTTTDVVLAEIELRKFEAGDVVEKRLELDLALEKGHREVARLTEKVARSRELFKKDFLSKDELEKDEIEFVEAQAELKKAEVAKEAYEEYTYNQERKKLESALDQAKSELEKTARKNESELASKEADLTNKRRRLELHEAMVAKYEGQLAKTQIKAPTDGLVVYATSLEQYSWMNNEQPLNVGTVIHPNQEIIMLPDTREMIAAVKVHESLVGRIKPGQHAMVTVDAVQGRKFEGAVESIGIMARSGGWRDPNVREYEVRITLELPESAHGLKPSMRCEGRITLMDVDDAIAVPLPGVFTEGANQFVYLIEGDKYVQSQVRVGRRSDTTAEIVNGVKEGQRIALSEPPTGRVVKAKFEQAPADGAGAPGPRGGGKGRRPEGAAKPASAPEPKPEDPKPASDENEVEDEDAAEAESEESEAPATTEAVKKDTEGS